MTDREVHFIIGTCGSEKTGRSATIVVVSVGVLLAPHFVSMLAPQVRVFHSSPFEKGEGTVPFCVSIFNQFSLRSLHPRLAKKKSAQAGIFCFSDCFCLITFSDLFVE